MIVFPWKKAPGYFAVQFLGAFFGSLLVGDMYYQVIHAVDPTKTFTGVIFHTHPNAVVNSYAATVRPSCRASRPVGILVVGIGMSFSMVSSAALNPARDLGPRIMLTLVGYDDIFTDHHHYFWIPIVAPIIGALTYLVFVMAHHPAVVPNKPSSEAQDVQAASLG
ncbi:hypothetical protein PybrP1_006542 [[Pythium] brassicae (nom. inval.)]|nr:hypothetical protein PybrP1_006542 [[Pythium] brassicae (nom. inval.)]